MLKSIRLYRMFGGMAEWLKAPVLKTGVGRKLHRGFESLSLRCYCLRNLGRCQSG